MGDYVKKLILLFMIIIFLSGCAEQPLPNKDINPVIPKNIRAVWLFYREISMAVENGGTAESYTRKINEIFDKCVSLGINTVFFHVRPFADSFYPSELFPMSEYVTGKQGGAIDYDPLKIAVSLAHQKNISIHAWINPFRISFSDDEKLLCESNPAKELIKKGSDRVCKVGGGLYFNPADEENHRLIINGVREIVNNYDVDGVHIDDYFYPSTDECTDKNLYDAYIKGGGALPLSDWRIQKINSFVSSLYSAVKAQNKNLIVSISPAGNIDNNYKSLYGDVKRWGSTKGYCDWLIPQIYFGFENSVLPYEKAVLKWRKITSEKSVRLIAGLAAYKAAQKDGEWASDDIISHQWSFAAENGYDGFAMFSYSSLVSDDFSAVPQDRPQESTKQTSR